MLFCLDSSFNEQKLQIKFGEQVGGSKKASVKKERAPGGQPPPPL